MSLDQWKSRYGVGDVRALEQLLDQAAAQTIPDASTLIRLHETLLFIRAYPQSAGVARRAEAILRTMAERIPSESMPFAEPEVSGIAGTSLTAVFSYEVARRLAARYPQVEIDWEAYDEPDRLGPVLRRLLPLVDEDWPVEAHPPFREWMAAGGYDLRWLLASIAKSGLNQRDRADLYESMNLALYWPVGDTPNTRTRLRVGAGPLHYFKKPLIRRKDVSLPDALQAEPLPIVRLSTREAEQILDAILDNSAMRYRELYGFTHPDVEHVYRAQAGRGLEIYFFGIPPEWRLPLRAYHAGMFFQNGVPAGYIEVLSLFDRAEVGFNLYYTFREGEAAWIYARVLQLIHQNLGLNTFAVDPYQLGHENDEALDSGAFWFYRKLGFRPEVPAITRLVEREELRIAGSPGFRSNRATLKKLAAGHLIFDGPLAKKKAWDGFAVRNIGFAAQRNSRRPGFQGALGPALDLIPDLKSWTSEEKSALRAIVDAKQGPEESAYLRLMQRHVRFREAIRKLGIGIRVDGAPSPAQKTTPESLARKPK